MTTPIPPTPAQLVECAGALVYPQRTVRGILSEVPQLNYVSVDMGGYFVDFSPLALDSDAWRAVDVARGKWGVRFVLLEQCEGYPKWAAEFWGAGTPKVPLSTHEDRRTAMMLALWELRGVKGGQAG